MEVLSNLPPLKGDAHDLVDWVELKVLASEFKSFSIIDLLHSNDELQETENINIQEQDTDNETVLEKLYEELYFRVTSLDVAYPFELSGKNKTALSLKSNLNIGNYTYLYCLFVSHYNRDDVLSIDPPMENKHRDILQICSTWAAAGDIGNAVSFGFPRSNKSAFLSELKRVYPKIKDGTVVDVIQPGTPSRQKDAGIDIIAWQQTLDDLPGKLYLLGQVASGENWKGKSVNAFIKKFHRYFFSTLPASTAIPAMFIPFCLAGGDGGSREEYFHALTIDFGKIYHRYRLPYYAYKGYQLSGSEGHYIERIDDADKLTSYVDSFLVKLAS